MHSKNIVCCTIYASACTTATRMHARLHHAARMHAHAYMATTVHSLPYGSDSGFGQSWTGQLLHLPLAPAPHSTSTEAPAQTVQQAQSHTYSDHTDNCSMCISIAEVIMLPTTGMQAAVRGWWAGVAVEGHPIHAKRLVTWTPKADSSPTMVLNACTMNASMSVSK